MTDQAIQAMKVDQNAKKKKKKWPPNHQKLKCSFLDYVKLLMTAEQSEQMKVD